MSPSVLLEYESVKSRTRVWLHLSDYLPGQVSLTSKKLCGRQYQGQTLSKLHVLLDCSWESQGPEFFFFFES